MPHLMLFLGLSFLVTSLLVLVQLKDKKLKPSALLGLFLFGIVLSIPFVLVEYVSEHLKYYFVILAFIGIELIVLTLEHKWKYLHDLIHHNIDHLRMLSFFAISIGFTYSELCFFVLSSHEPMNAILSALPVKGIFALFIHTVLTSSSSALSVPTESVVEHLIIFFTYYLRLVFISISHYLYVFLTEHKIVYLLIPFLAFNVYLFFQHKKYYDKKLKTF